MFEKMAVGVCFLVQLFTFVELPGPQFQPQLLQQKMRLEPELSIPWDAWIHELAVLITSIVQLCHTLSALTKIMRNWGSIGKEIIIYLNLRRRCYFWVLERLQTTSLTWSSFQAPIMLHCRNVFVPLSRCTNGAWLLCEIGVNYFMEWLKMQWKKFRLQSSICCKRGDIMHSKQQIEKSSTKQDRAAREPLN